MLICREVFQCRVLLCVWHIRRAWMRSILKKCYNFDVQREMFKHLGWILYCTRNGPNAMDAIEEFMQVFVDQRAFMDYFKIRWLPTIGIFPYKLEFLLFGRTSSLSQGQNHLLLVLLCTGTCNMWNYWHIFIESFGLKAKNKSQMKNGKTQDVEDYYITD